MKVSLVVAGFLLLLAVGLPLAAVRDHGLPWGFRGHAAVVVEVVGDAEATVSAVRAARRRMSGDRLVMAKNARLDAGDEVRVSRLGLAVLRFPAAVIEAGDDAVVVLGGEQRITLNRGQLRVLLPARPNGAFAVDVAGVGAVVVHGSDKAAQATLVADGAGALRARMTGGVLDALIGGGESRVPSGGGLTVVDGLVDIAGSVGAPTPSSVRVICTGGQLQVVAPRATQVFAVGALAYPGAPAGVAVFDVADFRGEAPVVVRDVVGQTTRVVATCGGSP